MTNLPVLLGVLGAGVTTVVTVVYVVLGTLLPVAGGIGVGLYLAAWIVWGFEVT